MCHRSCAAFIRTNLARYEVEERHVLEVGSCDVNGSVRPYIESLAPRSYLGVDFVEGPRVDRVCDAGDLVDSFGREAFDLVVSTEMLEHVRDWHKAISNMKQVLKPNGLLVLTTRSLGFPFHAYPHDYWRFEISDMETIFADFKIDVLETDPGSPGVFVKARKCDPFQERDLENHELYSIIVNRRALRVTDFQVWRFRVAQSLGHLLPLPMRQFIKHRILGRYP